MKPPFALIARELESPFVPSLGSVAAGPPHVGSAVLFPTIDHMGLLLSQHGSSRHLAFRCCYSLILYSQASSPPSFLSVWRFSSSIGGGSVADLLPPRDFARSRQRPASTRAISPTSPFSSRLQHLSPSRFIVALSSCMTRLAAIDQSPNKPPPPNSAGALWLQVEPCRRRVGEAGR